MRRIATGLAALAVGWMTLAGMGEARADPITYTVTGTFSGQYSAFDFTDFAVTITATADTANIPAVSPGIWAIDVSPRTLWTSRISGSSG